MKLIALALLALVMSGCANFNARAGLIERDPARWCERMGYAVTVTPTYTECLAPGEHE